MNREAINRVSADLPELLKQVDDNLNKFRHNAITDYHTDLPSNKNSEDESEESGDSFLEVGMQSLRAMPEVARLRLLKHKHASLKQLRDTIQLELDATSKITERVMGRRVKQSVPKGPDQELEATLRATSAMVENNPELKDWADDAKWRQNRGEINQLLAQSDSFLTHLSQRVKSDYIV